MGQITVVRSELKDLKEIPGWIIVYGRRKTGKTFLLKNFLKWDAYIYVRRDLSLRVDRLKTCDIRELPEAIGKILKSGGTAVIDEFQRLPHSTLEDLTEYHPSGKLILSGSSFGVVKKIFEPSSPLLGFFTPYKLSLLNPVDLIVEFSKHYSPVKTIEAASLLVDPWLIPLFKGDATKLIYEYACRYWHTVKALIGEVFAEEERTLTALYEATLSLVGSGVWKPKDIASILYTRGLVKEPSSSTIAGHLRNLIEMDLVEAIRIYRSKRKYYRLKSPIIECFYYLDDRYEVSEREVSYSEVKPTLEKLLRTQIEKLAASFMAQLVGGRREYILKPEVDFIVTVRGKPALIGEVKWGVYTKTDITKFIDKTASLPGKKVFIVREKHAEHPDVTVIDPSNLVDLAKELHSKNTLY